MLHLSRAASLMTLVVLSGCGSGGGSTPTTPVVTGPVTVAVTGTTRQTAVNACGGDSHTFNAAAGEISVRLTATSDPNAALSVQVCSGSSDTGSNCAIRQQRISTGQTLTGVRAGSADQTLKFLPFACVFTSTVDTTPMTYSASLTHQR